MMLPKLVMCICCIVKCLEWLEKNNGAAVPPQLLLSHPLYQLMRILMDVLEISHPVSVQHYGHHQLVKPNVFASTEMVIGFIKE